MSTRDFAAGCTMSRSCGGRENARGSATASHDAEKEGEETHAPGTQTIATVKGDTAVFWAFGHFDE